MYTVYIILYTYYSSYIVWYAWFDHVVRAGTGKVINAVLFSDHTGKCPPGSLVKDDWIMSSEMFEKWWQIWS